MLFFCCHAVFFLISFVICDLWFWTVSRCTGPVQFPSSTAFRVRSLVCLLLDFWPCLLFMFAQRLFLSVTWTNWSEFRYKVSGYGMRSPVISRCEIAVGYGISCHITVISMRELQWDMAWALVPYTHTFPHGNCSGIWHGISCHCTWSVVPNMI